MCLRRRFPPRNNRRCLIRPAATCLLLAAMAGSLRPADTFSTEMLAAHNRVRAGVKVPPLAWSAKLAEVAAKWADHLLSTGRFEHQGRNPYGENLFEARGGTVSAAEVVADWASEAADYDYRTNTCRGVCGHYTQLVWRGTRAVGCASAERGGRQVVACEYDPPGNWKGQRPW